MRDYRRSAHTVHAVHCHFVFCTKYRKPVLRGEIGQEVRKQIQQICRGHDVEILQGHVRPDHVHLLLGVPPHLSPSRVMQAVKGKTSHRLLMDHRRLRKEFWGRHLWARGYFVAWGYSLYSSTHYRLWWRFFFRPRIPLTIAA